MDTSGIPVIRWAGRVLEITEACSELRGAQSLVPGKWHLNWGRGFLSLRVAQEPGSTGAGLEVEALGAGWTPGG